MFPLKKYLYLISLICIIIITGLIFHKAFPVFAQDSIVEIISDFIDPKPELTQKDFKSNEDIEVDIKNNNPEKLTFFITDPQGKEVSLEKDISLKKITFKPPDNFSPGKYQLKINNGNKTISEQNFNWGVLAINTPKSIYLPNEIIRIDMAVLDEKGNMVCDAQLKLIIKNESLNINDELSTENNKISVNPECLSHNFTLNPDYSANYQVGVTGIYSLELTAITPNGEYKITDSFEVRDSVPFDIKRDTATRIYPPHNYPVTFNIAVNQNFEGEIQESVPLNFEIYPPINNLPYTSIEIKDNKKIIKWQLNLKAGDKVNLGYYYKAPNLSPQFYLLGPLTFIEHQKIINEIENPTVHSPDSFSVIKNEAGEIIQIIPKLPDDINPKEEVLNNTIETKEIEVFKELRPWQIAADLPNKNGFAAYQLSSQPTTPKIITWDVGTTSWSVPANGTTLGVGSTARWVVVKACPTRDEIAVATLDALNSIKIQLCNYAGTCGSVKTLTTSATISTRRLFDIEYEKSSGDLVVVYQENVAQSVSYDRWNGTAWSGELPLTIGTASTQNSYWIDLYAAYDSSSPNPDNMMLVVETNTTSSYSDLYAVPWGGSANSFGSVQSISTTLEPVTSQGFGGAYEDVSGEFILFYSQQDVGTLQYSSYNGSWSSGTGRTSASADIHNFRAAVYPDTNRIMVCWVAASQADLDCQEWNGDSLSTGVNIDGAIEAVVHPTRAIDVAPVLGTGGFLLMYGDSNVNYFDFAQCTSQANCQSGTWVIRNPDTTDLGTDTRWGQLYADPNGVGHLIWWGTSQTAANGWFRGRITCDASNCALNEAATSVGGMSSISYEGAMFDFITYTAPPPTINLSGTVYINEGSINIGSSKTVNLRVGGSGTYSAETNSSGYWAINGIIATSGQIITAYLNDEDEKATTVMVSDGVGTSNVDLYVNQLIVRHDVGTTISNTALALGDDNDPDVKYTVSSNNLTVDPGIELHIWTGDTFDPGGIINTNSSGGLLHLDDNAITFLDTDGSSIGVGVSLDIGSTLNIDAGTTINGSIATSGTGKLTYSTGNPTLTLLGTGILGGGSQSLNLNNLTINNTGNFTLQNELVVNNVLNLNGGVLNAGSNTIHLIGSSVPFVIGSGSTFNPDNSTVSYENTNSANITAATYYNLQTNPSSGNPVYSLILGNYSVPITITNTNSSLTDFQVMVTVDTASLIAAGKLQSACQDIRFRDSDNQTALSYWIESSCGTSTTKVWVKVPSIPASSQKTIYLHYGDDSAESASSADDTFIFFDDFESGNLNKWWITTNIEIIDDNGNNVAQLQTGAGNFLGVGTSSSAWVNFLVHNKVKCAVAGTFGCRFETMARSNPPTGDYRFGVNTNNTLCIRRSNVSVLDQSAHTNTVGVWYTSDFYVNGSTLRSWVDSGYPLGTPYLSATDSNITYGGIGFNTWDTNSVAYIDDVFVRQAANTDPSTSLGIETGPGNSISINNNLILTGTGHATFNPQSIELTIGGNLSIGVGNTFLAPTSNLLTIGGNFTNDGTFNHNSGTVEFIGSNQNYDGNSKTTFYNLRIIGNIARNFTFDTGTTLAVADNGSLVLSGGGVDNRLVLSTGDSTPWNLQVSQTNTSVGVSYVTVSYSDATGYKQIDASNGTNINNGNNINWLFPVNISVSGNIYSNEGSNPFNCSQSNLTVKVQVNGSGNYEGTCTLNTGYYSVPNVTIGNTGDVVTVYIYNETEKAATVTKANSTISNIENLPLYQDRLVLTHENSGPITIDNLSGFDYDNDTSNLFFTSNSNILSVNSGKKLVILSSKTFTPGGNVILSGSFANFGSINWENNLISFNSPNIGNSISGNLTGTNAFYKVLFHNDSGGGEWLIADSLKIGATNLTDTFIIGNGAVTFGDSAGDSLEINGKMSIGATANQTGIFQTNPINQGNITIDLNNNSSPVNCPNCIIQVGATGGTGQGSLKLGKNTILRLNPNTSSSDTGIEVEANGYLEVQGGQDSIDSSGIDSVDHSDGLITLTDTGKSWNNNEHQNKIVRITNTSSLAFGKIYTIASNGSETINIQDNQSTSDSGGSITTTGMTRTITSSVSLITTNSEGIGQYIYNLTDDKYYRITNSTNNGSTDTFTIVDYPDSFPSSLTGKTIKITDGIRSGDNFEIISYAYITAENGTACNATINQSYEAYIYAKSGSETLLNYADVCNLGKSLSDKYGLTLDNINGSIDDQGLTINKSRIHHGYYGLYLSVVSNNSTTYSKGISNSSIYNNNQDGILFTGLVNIGQSNSTLNNHIYNNLVSGIQVNSGSSGNIFQRNYFYGNTVGGLGIFSVFQTTVDLNTAYNNGSEFYISGGSRHVITSNTAFGASSTGIYLGAPLSVVAYNTIYNQSRGIYLTDISNAIIAYNNLFANQYGLDAYNATNNISIGNSINENTDCAFSNRFSVSPNTGIIVNDSYGEISKNLQCDLLIASAAHQYTFYNTLFASDIAVSGVNASNSYVISKKHNKTNGQTGIWGKYSTPASNSETPQSEEIDKFNYVNNLWEDSTTDPFYAGTGTKDDNLDIGFSGGSLMGENSVYLYRIVCQNSNCVTSPNNTWKVYRDEVDIGNLSTGSTYTDTTTKLQIQIDDSGDDFVLGDTYTFIAFKKSNDTDTQKNLTLYKDRDTFTVPQYSALELKGGSEENQRTLVSRGGSGTTGYNFIVNGTIDARYYKFSYLKETTHTGIALDLTSTATVNDLSYGIFDNFPSYYGGSTYIQVNTNLIQTGTPQKTFSHVTFIETSNGIPQYTVSVTGGAVSGYWLFDQATCTGWSSCEASDLDGGSGLGYVRFTDPIVNNPPSNPYSISQTKTDDTVISTGAWTNSSSVKFSVGASDPNNPDTLYLCIEKKPVGISFTDTEDSCGSGVSYSGIGITLTHIIEGIGDSSYHWQARVKDNAGAYSSWVQYSNNAESEMDFGVDASAPTGGVVYDGLEPGIDKEFNNGSLSVLSANWSGVDTSISGLNHYEYSIGTSVTATDVKAWTNNDIGTSATVSGLTLQTSKIYYFNIRNIDNAGNTSPAIYSDGQVVAPSLSFGISANSLNFTNLNATNNYSVGATTIITTSTNAYNGYLIRAYLADNLKSTINPSIIIPHFNGGTYSNPSAWLENHYGFGYHSTKLDNTPCSGGGNPPCYSPFSTSPPGDIIVDHTANITGTTLTDEKFTIDYKVKVNPSQLASDYSTTVIYLITAQY